MHQTKNGSKEVVSQSVPVVAKNTKETIRKHGNILNISSVKTFISLGGIYGLEI
jgi:hypothetical protein